jgi:hypothetical protein
LGVTYGIYSSWTHSIILRLVEDGEEEGGIRKAFVVGSNIATAGNQSSADLIPAILSIIFQVCAAEGMMEYHTLERPSKNPVDPVDDDDGDNDDDPPSNEPSEDSGGSSYEPSSGDQGSSPYGSPDASGKRAAHQNNMGSNFKKKQRSGNFAPVSWSSLLHQWPESELQRQRWCFDLNTTGVDSVMQ